MSKQEKIGLWISLSLFPMLFIIKLLVPDVKAQEDTCEKNGGVYVPISRGSICVKKDAVIPQETK
jgi:hypothetical protein